MGHHREVLEELAHAPSREAAAERRQKKKDRKANKKSGGKKNKKQMGAAVEDEDAAAASPMDFGSSGADDEVDEDALYDEIENADDGMMMGNDGADDEEAEVMLPDTDLIKDKMMKLVDKFEESLKGIRGGEPTPELFDSIMVNAYGSMTPLQAVGQVVIASPTLVQITCFDPSVAKEVQKSIQLAMGLNPQLEEGGLVRIPIPRPSLESRQETVKQVQKRAEGCKQRIRRVRHKVMDVIKKGKDGKLPGISKDDAFAVGKELDSVTEEAMNGIKDVVAVKTDTIMG